MLLNHSNTNFEGIPNACNYIVLIKKEVKILLNIKESRTTQETKRTIELYPGPQVELVAKINQGEASYDQ